LLNKIDDHADELSALLQNRAVLELKHHGKSICLPEKIALFGSIALVPVNWRPGRYGLATTLFEILSFRPVRKHDNLIA
jgi:hypothetical protein